MSLTDWHWGLRYDSAGSEPLSSSFFKPAMRLSQKYNRGTGFFSSSLFEVLGAELQEFLATEGEFRILTSVRLSEGDYQALIHGHDAEQIAVERIKAIIEEEFAPPISDGAQALTRLIQLGRLHLRIGVTPRGIYHEKIGYFQDVSGNIVAWSGSANDGEMAYEANFEEVTVFTGWEPVRQDYAKVTVEDFEKRWSKEVHLKNLAVFDFPDAAKQQLIEILSQTDHIAAERRRTGEIDKWRHQTEVLSLFLADREPDLLIPPRPAGRQGILCMATGTGKTRTACKIIRAMVERGDINRVVVTTHLVDVLDQWGKEFDELLSDFFQFRQYGNSRQLGEYRWSSAKFAALLCSRDTFQDFLQGQNNRCSTTLLIVDECHNFRGAGHVATSGAQYEQYQYRLGLSATPYSPYSADANSALDTQIGPVFFTFGIEDAIRRRILCPFNYDPIEFELTPEEHHELVAIRRKYEYLIKMGQASQTDMWIDLSNVYKLSESKLPLFEDLVKKDPSILNRCIIFVQTKAYGEKVFDILMRCGGENRTKWHHYFADAEKHQLTAFRRGNIECLVTCQKLNEGVDIKSVKNIVLFASEHGEDGLTTTQRIGRALRFDDTNPEKVARVIDFTRKDAEPSSNDIARRDWLIRLAQIRPDNWEGA